MADILSWLRGIVGQRLKDQDAELARLRAASEAGAERDRKRAERLEKRLEETLAALVELQAENARLRENLAALPKPPEMPRLPYHAGTMRS